MFSLKHAASERDVRVAYNRLYARRWLPRHASQLTWLVSLLKPRPGQTLLDVACGDAQMAYASGRFGLTYYGLDISEMALKASGIAATAVADGAHIPFASAQFDYVTSIGSLEHYWDMATGVAEMARVLKPDGLACVLVPNAFGLTWNVWQAWRTGELADDDGQPVQRFGTRQAWLHLLQTHGLDVRRVVGHERAWPRTREEIQAYVNEPKEIVLALLAPLLPANMKRCFIFLCTKGDRSV